MAAAISKLVGRVRFAFQLVLCLLLRLLGIDTRNDFGGSALGSFSTSTKPELFSNTEAAEALREDVSEEL